MKWTTFTLWEYLEREQNIVFCGNITNWYWFSKSILSISMGTRSVWLIEISSKFCIFSNLSFSLLNCHIVFALIKVCCDLLDFLENFPNQLNYVEHCPPWFNFIVLYCCALHVYYTLKIKYNKLAKLGDPIAISKSETINHSPTHSLTHWLYFICHKFGFKFFKFSFENTNTITDRGSTATHSKAKLDGLDWIGCYLESLSSQSTVLFLKFFPLKVFGCVASSWDL